MGHNDLDDYFAKKSGYKIIIFEHIFQPIAHM